MRKESVIFSILFILTLVSLTTAYEFCENTTLKSKLEITEIIYQEQANETTWTWGPTKEITIEVEVENKNFTQRDFEVELFLLDENSNIEKLTSNTADTTQTISLNTDQTKTLTFSFQLKEGISGTYSLHAKLTDPSNESICTNLEAASTGDEVTIEIESEEKIIIIRNINGPTEIIAGSQAEYIIEVINLGNVEEDRVLVIVYNANLNIREEKEIIGLGIEESKNVTINFIIPKNTTTQEEIFLFSTEYGYQNKTGFYYQFSDKDKILLVQIETQASQVENQTENQTQAIPEENTTTQTETQATEKDTSETSYFWIILIISVVLIITAIFFFLKYKGEPKIETEVPTTNTSAASDYVKSIQNKTTSNPPNKLS